MSTKPGQGHYDTQWGNVDSIADPIGLYTAVRLDGYGRADTTYIPQVGPSSVTYGKLNEIKGSTGPTGLVTTTTLDADLIPERVTDPKGQVYKFSYNAAGLSSAVHDLADTLKADSVWYDVAGNVRKVKRKGGAVLTMTYDAVGRLLTRTGPGTPTDTLRYDANGLWHVAANGVSYDSLVYDHGGRLVTSLQITAGGTYRWDYDYDAKGRLILRTNPDSTRQRRLYYGDDTGRLDSLCAGGACMAMNYTAGDIVTYVSYRSGSNYISENIYRDDRGVVTERGFTSPPADLGNRFGSEFVRDSLDQVIERQFYDGRVERFAYDSLGRVTNGCVVQGLDCVNEWGGSGQAYKYDAAGNRRTAGQIPQVVGPGNRIIETAGWYFTYDNDGNVIKKCIGSVFCSSGQQYVWDAFGRLTQVKDANGNVMASYGYDALGRRVSKTTGGTTEYYVYDGADVVLDMTGSHAFRREYGYMPGVDNLWLIKNTSWAGVAVRDPLQGTIEGVASFLGTAIKDYTLPIRPWGRSAADTGQVVRFGLGGRELDQETGLYYLRARYYDPQTGRFLTEDPIGIAGGLNLYSYTANNPISRNDPSGLNHCGPPPPDVLTEACGHPDDCKLTPRGWTCLNGTSVPRGRGSEYGCYYWSVYNDTCSDPVMPGDLGQYTWEPAVLADPGDEAARKCRSTILATTGTALLDITGISFLKKAHKGARGAWGIARTTWHLVGKSGGHYAVAKGNATALTVAGIQGYGLQAGAQGSYTFTTSTLIGNGHNVVSYLPVPFAGTAAGLYDSYKACFHPGE